ncbi:glycosyltransferase [Microaerobacter geothermalis]|uniref:glycosyltransferase n=1 Tax=Microaerobacter geothermalis TaxID=674972 RepID=UPI001F25EAA1|nr:glycosyltransferase [Microaerobacter geothermalis]MCF6093314.1 glycosyltransferase [Microaerobacter geothermalis]
MLYFCGYEDTENSWQKNFNTAFLSELDRLKIPYKRLPNRDWTTKVTKDWEEAILSIESKDTDIWFIAWAKNPIMHKLKEKSGKKYTRIAGLGANPYEQAVLTANQGNFPKVKEHEKKMFSLFDGIFMNSYWSMKLAKEAYPHLVDKFIYSGQPTDFSDLEEEKKKRRYIPKLIILNSRFIIERLPLIEIELAKRLIREGFRIWHLQSDDKIMNERLGIAHLVKLAEESGIEFIHTSTKKEYFQLLSKGQFLLSTSISEMMPVSACEAIYMGLIPIVPDFGPFKEIVHPNNRYPQYDLEAAVQLLKKEPHENHDISDHMKENSVWRMLTYMNGVAPTSAEEK